MTNPWMTLQQVFDQLMREKQLSSQNISTLSQVFHEPLEEQQVPWFVQVLMTFGAWMAANIFLVFIGLLLSFDLEDGILTGSILMVSTIFLYQVRPKSLFLKQFALALNLVGQVLFILGVSFDEKDIFTAALTTLILEIIILVVYWDAIARFLAVILATLAGLVLFYDAKIYWGIHIVVLVASIGATGCWLGENNFLTHKMTAKLYQPLGYGWVVVLLMMLLPSILPSIEEIPIISWWISTLGLLLLLLSVEYYLLYFNDVQIHSPQSYLILGGTLFVTLFLYQAPGIIAAVLVMILGFQQSHRVLMGLAIIFLAIFLVAYYYHLPVTLLMKSMTLMGTGLAMLGFYWILKYLQSTSPLLDK